MAFTRELLKRIRIVALPLVLTLMARTTATLGAGIIRAQLYAEMTFYLHPKILSSCDLVAVVINSNHSVPASV